MRRHHIEAGDKISEAVLREGILKLLIEGKGTVRIKAPASTWAEIDPSRLVGAIVQAAKIERHLFLACLNQRKSFQWRLPDVRVFPAQQKPDRPVKGSIVKVLRREECND